MFGVERVHSGATRHRLRTKTACDRHLQTIGLRSKDSPLTLCVCSTPNTLKSNTLLPVHTSGLWQPEVVLWRSARHLEGFRGHQRGNTKTPQVKNGLQGGASSQTGSRNMAVTCAIDFSTSISYSTSYTLLGLSPTVWGSLSIIFKRGPACLWTLRKWHGYLQNWSRYLDSKLVPQTETTYIITNF